MSDTLNLPVLSASGQPVAATDCWNRIGVRGDRSCPELVPYGHCFNCPVFARAGRQFLDGPSPAGYLEEWTQRLATPPAESASDLQGVLVFRLSNEWLALRVGVLIEVTHTRPVHRLPHRGGLLAGLVNVRGELQLCVRLDQLLGLEASDGSANKLTPVVSPQPHSDSQPGRLLVVQGEGDRWVFAVDEVDQVHRVAKAELSATPATLGRSAARLTQGVFSEHGRAIGLLDEAKLFHTLRTRIR